MTTRASVKRREKKRQKSTRKIAFYSEVYKSNKELLGSNKYRIVIVLF